MSDTIGMLRDRIAIETAVETSDGGGGVTVIWTELDRVWAKVSAVNSVVRNAELYRSEQMQPRNVYRVVIRYRDDLREDMRIIHGSKVLYIRSIIVFDTASDRMDLIVEEGVHL